MQQIYEARPHLAWSRLALVAVLTGAVLAAAATRLHGGIFGGEPALANVQISPPAVTPVAQMATGTPKFPERTGGKSAAARGAPKAGVAALQARLAMHARHAWPTAPENPFRHLEEVKTRIYENLRDLQFEYRLGKLSDADYQSSKLAVQKELGQILGEIDAVKQRLAAEGKTVATTSPGRKKPQSYVCPHCKATFKEALKFCGECGKAMSA